MIINTDLIYPIGSIYMNINLVNPGKLFGGTWVRIEARYLMGAGRPSKNSYDGFGQITDSQCTNLNFEPATLGELTHTLSYQEMPQHNHGQAIYWSDGGAGTGYVGVTFNSSGNSGNKFWASYDAGGGQSHNNLPPTLVVYIWKRTA